MDLRKITNERRRSMLLEKGSRLIMVGDSITDCGRDYNAQPAGWGSFGEGYVNLVNAFLTGLCPQYEIMVINKGVNGNTIVDLKERWEKDVLALQPDWVSVMIGVNDVWRHFDTVLQQIKGTTIEEYERTYRQLVDSMRDRVKGIIIMSPFMIEPNKKDEMRQMVEEYAAVARKIAREYGLIYADIQAAVDNYLEHLSPYIISADRVNPNLSGHMIIAREFMKSIEFEWK